MSASTHLDAIRLDNLDDYREFLSKTYIHTWKKAPIQDIERVFSLPKRFPCLLYIKKNRLDAWGNKRIVFVYENKTYSTDTYEKDEY